MKISFGKLSNHHKSYISKSKRKWELRNRFKSNSVGFAITRHNLRITNRNFLPKRGPDEAVSLHLHVQMRSWESLASLQANINKTL